MLANPNWDIEGIEGFGAELETESLVDRKLLVKANIPVFQPGSVDTSTYAVLQVKRARRRQSKDSSTIRIGRLEVEAGVRIPIVSHVAQNLRIAIYYPELAAGTIA